MNLGLEYLRFALAMIVLAYHYLYLGPGYGEVPRDLRVGEWMAYGPFAVLAFFILSGIVISYSAESKTWQDFAAARFARLVPAIVVCATATFAVLLVLSDDSLGDLVHRYLRAVSFFPLIADGPMIDGAYWSLKFELRFYLLVAVVIWLGGFRYLPEILVAMVVTSLVLFKVGEVQFQPVLGALLFPHAPMFAVGVLIYRLKLQGVTLWNLFLLAACVAAATKTERQWFRWTGFQEGTQSGNLEVLIVLLVCVLTVFVAFSVKFGEGHFAVARALGGISFPLYLSHQLIGFELIDAWSGTIGQAAATAVAAGVLVAFSFLVFAFVERRYAPVLRRAAKTGLDRIAGAGARGLGSGG